MCKPISYNSGVNRVTSMPYLINQTPGEIALRRGRTSTTLVDLTLVLWTPGPIRSHREEFLPEGLRAYGRPLYENSMFLVRR